MWKIIKEILLISIIFLILDLIWIMVIMKEHYNKLILSIQGSPLEFSILPAILCYLVILFGLFFLVANKVKKFDILDILSHSIPFGLSVYGTFDFTSAAMLKKWDSITVVVDILWGTFALSISVMIAIYFREKNEQPVLEIENENLIHNN